MDADQLAEVLEKTNWSDDPDRKRQARRLLELFDIVDKAAPAAVVVTAKPEDLDLGGLHEPGHIVAVPGAQPAAEQADEPTAPPEEPSKPTVAERARAAADEGV